MPPNERKTENLHILIIKLIQKLTNYKINSSIVAECEANFLNAIL
jgi:hypothetical protein